MAAQMCRSLKDDMAGRTFSLRIIPRCVVFVLGHNEHCLYI